MPSIKTIKQRIKSVKSTAQITKAMEAVSATKMRKAQEFALTARPYAAASFELLQNLLARTPVEMLPSIFRARPVQNSLLLVITSDKGLAGAFNANVLRKAEGLANNKRDLQEQFSLVTVGKKAKEYFERRNFRIEKSFWGFGDFSKVPDTLPVADFMLKGFLDGKWDEVQAVYTNFRSTLVQEAVLKQILPATKKSLEEIIISIVPERGKYSELRHERRAKGTQYTYEYVFEPSPREILSALVPQLFRIHLHHLILESNASEHSARMVAMKNASENAKELISDLSLVYNKMRQGSITRELTEITAGREALEN